MFKLLQVTGGFLHAGHCSPQHVIRPDHHRKPMLPEDIGGRGIIFGGHDHDRASIRPFPFERQDLVRNRKGAVNQDAVRARLPIGLGSTQGLHQPPAADQCLHSGNYAKVRVGLSIFPALILPQNSCMSARGWASPFIKLFVFGKSLSSIHTAAMLRCSSLRTNRCMLLKLPYPVSPSRKMGILVASDINSRLSRTCVQLASLLSRTPNWAEIERPLAQIPGNRLLARFLH